MSETEVVLRYAGLGTLLGTALALVLVLVFPDEDAWLLPAFGGVMFALLSVGLILTGELP